MRSIVTFLLLFLLGAIAAILLSNTAPIALTFLGMKTLALPLAVWIAAALLAGGATGLWFLVLFRLAERRGARWEREQRRTEFGLDDFAVLDDGERRRQEREFIRTQEPDREKASAYGDSGYGNNVVDRQYDQYDGAYDSAYSEGYRTDYRNDGRNRAEVDEIGTSRRERYRDEPDSRWERDSLSQSREEGGGTFAAPDSVNPPSEPSDRFSAETEFEVVEAAAPVYDASYRVIQPPASQDRNSDRSRSRRNEPTSTHPDAAAEEYGEHLEAGARRSETESAYAAGPERSQPQDDWDIEDDLDW